MGDEMIMEPGVDIRPVITTEEIRQFVLDLYGLKISKITELVGYDDRNFRITVEPGKNENIGEVSKDGYVFKIINSLDSKNPQCFEAQNELLLHLRKKEIQCPKPIPLKDGSFFTKVKLVSGEHIIRLLEFISGTIFCKVPSTPSLHFQVGEFVANIDEALQDFHHPLYDTHQTLWMLKSVPQLRDFLFAVTDESRKAMAAEIINEFELRVLSSPDQLRKGIIHGDFNEQNIIVEEQDEKWRIKAVIDFGDSNMAYYIFELATSMAYMIFHTREVDTGGYVVGGYMSVRKVPDIELRLLKICVAARMCQSLVLGAYSILKDPENLYAATTSTHGWSTLEEIWQEPEEQLLERWMGISKIGP